MRYRILKQMIINTSDTADGKRDGCIDSLGNNRTVDGRDTTADRLEKSLQVGDDGLGVGSYLRC